MTLHTHTHAEFGGETLHDWEGKETLFLANMGVLCGFLGEIEPVTE